MKLIIFIFFIFCLVLIGGKVDFRIAIGLLIAGLVVGNIVIYEKAVKQEIKKGYSNKEARNRVREKLR